MLRRHITCQLDRRRTSSAINAEVTRPRGLTSGSARWLTSRAVGHVAAPDPRLALIKAWVFFALESRSLL
jgi:hypothetical protein